MPIVGSIKDNERLKNGGNKEHNNSKRNIIARAYRERFKHHIPTIVRMVALGYHFQEIAKEVGLKTVTVTKMYARETQRLKKIRDRETDFVIDKTELQYQAVIKECFLAFERSKVNRKGQPVKPDVAYIDRVLQALEAIRKLRGLDKTPQPTSNQQNGQFNWYSLIQLPQPVTPPTQLPQANQNVSVIEPNPIQQSAPIVKEKGKDDADKLIEALNNRAKELGLIKDNKNEQSNQPSE